MVDQVAGMHSREYEPPSFWSFPTKVRLMILREAFRGRAMTIRALTTRRLSGQGQIATNAQRTQLDNLLVSKAFFLEAFVMFLRYAVFTFERPSTIIRPSLGPSINSANTPGLARLFPWMTISNLRNFTASTQDLGLLAMQTNVNRFTVQSITVEMVSPYEFGLRTDFRRISASPGQLNTAFMSDCINRVMVPLRPYLECDPVIALTLFHSLRDVHVPMKACEGCQNRGRFCQNEMIQAEIELCVLRRILVKAVKRGQNEQVCVLWRNIGEKKDIWAKAARAAPKFKAEEMQDELEWEEIREGNF